MTEPERIKTRLRSAETIEELASVWRDEGEAIWGLDDVMKIQVTNLKDYRKAFFND